MTSWSRTDRLSNAETVRTGRLLQHFLPVNHSSYPEGTPTAVVVAHEHDLHLAPAIRAHMKEYLGDFTEEVVRD